MSMARLITAAGITLFLAGNFLVMQQSAEPPAARGEAGAGPSRGGLSPEQRVMAESTVRRLRGEIGTTNALLDRPVALWHDDDTGGGGGGAALGAQVAALERELAGQTAALGAKLRVLDGDLDGLRARAAALPLAPPPPVSGGGDAAAGAMPQPASLPPAIRPPGPGGGWGGGLGAAAAKVGSGIGLTGPPPPPPPPPLAALSYPTQRSPPSPPPQLGGDSALLMICFNRADYLERSLAAVKRFHPGRAFVPGQAPGSSSSSSGGGGGGGLAVVVSQDGAHGGVARVAAAFKKAMAEQVPGAPVVHLQHPQARDGGDAYHKLAQHYGWALDQVFTHLHTVLVPGRTPVARCVVLEEDLEVSPDFFAYFAATAPLLDDPDEHLLAVSAWNDNGQGPHVANPRAVYRSSFFPGLGWMLNRGLWEELAPKWPKGYWDDWLREPPQQQGREVLRPEVCRTFHFATVGTSNNEFSDFLTSIKPNKDPNINWSSDDLAYLIKERYDLALRAELEKAPLVSLDDARQGRFPGGEEQGGGWGGEDGEGGEEGGESLPAVRVEYPRGRWAAVARRLGIMDNVKAGVPRTAYHGVVTVRLGPQKRKVHVAPPLADLRL